MARPKKQIDEKAVTELAFEGNSDRTIADLLGVSHQTIASRFRPLLNKKRAERRRNLKLWQTKAAESGNVTMLIWLGKNELGQSDQPHADGNPEPELDAKVG